MTSTTARDVSSRLDVRAETIVDNDGPGRPGLYVAVTINPSAVMLDLARALVAHWDALDGMSRARAALARMSLMDRINDDPAVKAALTVVLTQDQAETLAEELTAAAQDPNDCIGSDWCPGYAQHPSGLCDACEDAKT